MSDVEEYAYSPFDDVDDSLDDSDPVPELADDLAERTTHSPVFFDEPAGYELQHYHSDWEYYSDDYMDDDPVLLRLNPPDGTAGRPPGKAKPHLGAGSKRVGRKRKLAEMEDISPLDLGERKMLVDCIKGTVWAKPINQDVPIYHEGQYKKVALLKNWKEVFATNGPSRGKFAKGPLRHDEAWANDMSLADMGLHNARGQALNQRPRGLESELVHGGEEEEEEEEEEEAEEEAKESSETVSSPEIDDADDPRSDVTMSQLRTRSTTISKPVDSISDSPLEAQDGIRQKRRRLDVALPSPPTSNESVVIDAREKDVLTATSASPHNQSLPLELRTFPADQEYLSSSSSSRLRSGAANNMNLTRGRKRKADDDQLDEDDGSAGSTAAILKKRVPSEHMESGQSDAVDTGGPKRRTRSRKK